MIKLMSLLLTFFVFLMTAAMTLADDTTPPNRSPESTIKTSETNLTSNAKPNNEPTKSSEIISDKTLEEKSNEMLEEVQNSTSIIRLTWKIVPYAVKYRVSFDDEVYITYINGIELAVNDVSKVFKVDALDFDDNILTEDLDIIEAETNPLTVKTTTEFDKMNYAPLYPVYSWIPKHNADYYQVQLLKDGEVIRDYVATKSSDDDEVYDFYDQMPINESGNYYWRVKAMSRFGFALTDWSKEIESVSFKVNAPTKYAAFGDSITHGGGAITVPPSMTIYNWETYCKESIKNLGRSGDTTDQLVERFESDVLPFSPKVLFIMGGVNDFRGRILGWHTVSNLKILLEKCKEYDITPVFITPTPVNVPMIKKTNYIEQPPVDWKNHYQYICNWIRNQENCIDLSLQFEDYDGYLRYNLTTDGLHPDIDGKKIIGEAVNEWLKNNEEKFSQYESNDKIELEVK